MSKWYAEFFAKPEPAIFIDEAIFLLNYNCDSIISIKREKGQVKYQVNPS